MGKIILYEFIRYLGLYFSKLFHSQVACYQSWSMLSIQTENAYKLHVHNIWKWAKIIDYQSTNCREIYIRARSFFPTKYSDVVIFFLPEHGFRRKQKRTACLNLWEYYWSEDTVVTKIRNCRSFGLEFDHSEWFFLCVKTNTSQNDSIGMHTVRRIFFTPMEKKTPFKLSNGWSKRRKRTKFHRKIKKRTGP